MIRILIVDDHAVVRRGLSQIIEETVDMRVADEAVDYSSAIEKIQNNEYDIVLLDISMPGRNGFDVLSQVKQLKTRLPILVLSMHPEEQYGIRAMKAGASGYITKESAPDELIAAIRKVAAGGKYISPTLTEKVLSEIALMDERPPHERLSHREMQVLCMIAAGKRVKQIAEDLSLSEKTVSTYRTRILEKMNIASNSELTRYAIDNHLIE